MKNKFLVITIFLITCRLCIVYADQNAKHVLFISSYHPAFPTFNQQIEGIRSVFDKENILLDIEFMDTKRFPGADNVRLFHNMLSFKLKKLQVYDAVIVADDAAFLYALTQINGLFNNIPLFFCGVNDLEMAASVEKNTRIRGVVEAVSMKENLELIRNLFPGRSNLVVITDGTITGQAELKNLIKKIDDLPFKLEILNLENLTFNELNSRLKESEKDTDPGCVIFLLSAYTDRTGSTKLFYDSLGEIYKNSHAPIFHLWEHGLGKGIFGGKLVRHFEQGREAAAMTLNFFNGTSPDKIKNIIDSPNRYSFDYHELERFNISVSELPEGSIVINKPPSFYQVHKPLIITSAIFITALLYIVILLLFESRRLRKMVGERTKELADSEERWKFSIESSGQMVWDWNIESNKVFVLKPWGEKNISYNKEMYEDLDVAIMLIHEDDRIGVGNKMAQHLSGEKPFYENFHRIVSKDGSFRWVLSRGKVIEKRADGTPLRVIGTSTDVTGLKQIEDEISRSRRTLQLVLDTIPVGVFWKNTDLTYLGCNNSFARMIGVQNADSIVGKKDIELFDNETAGSYNFVDMEILRTGTAKLNYEDQMILPSGKVRILRKSKAPITDVTGKTIGVLGTYEDVTSQKQLREETFRIQKLESVGILASGIAHDFNNLLMAISGSLSVLRISGELSEKNLKWIENAERSCFAATELTTRLITFSRGGAPVLQQENIIEVINEAVETGKGSSAVFVNYRNESPYTSIMIDGRQIRQVVINLIENAKEAMHEKGLIDILSSEIILGNDNRFELPSGRYLVISLKDTGPGIPESIITKIFDPYFSTKEMGAQKGQGLGLAICYSIITQHGGKIIVESIPGKGSRFIIYIPFGSQQ